MNTFVYDVTKNSFLMETWDNLYIYYISGTGNARISSEWISDEAIKRGIKATVLSIDKPENLVFPEFSDRTLVGFAFPTHGFNAAPIMLRFIAGFPKRVCRNVFLMNTRAGMKLYKIFLPGISGVALLMPAFILLLKGYRCIGFRPVDLPSNWIPLHPGLRKKIIDSIFERCEPIVRRFANRLLDGKRVWKGLVSVPFDLLISPIALAYYIGGRFFLSKTFIANSRCNNCNLCIKECPTSSIKLVSGRPYWKLTCESCMRCLNRCPVRAIETAHGMAFLFWLAYSTANAWLFMFILDHTTISKTSLPWKIFTNLAGIGMMVVITALLYRLLHHAMALKIIRNVARFTSLTALSFWRRYKFPSKK